MTPTTRRAFLGDLGKGVLALGLGPTLASEAAFAASLALAGGALDLAEAEADGALSVEGDRRLFRASLRAFGAA